MRTNDFKEVKVLDEKSLIAKAKVIRGELAELIMDKNMGKLKDVKVISKKKKDLAQVLTTLRQKQLLRSLEPNIESEVKEEVKSQNSKVTKKGAK